MRAAKRLCDIPGRTCANGEGEREGDRKGGGGEGGGG